MPLLFFILLYFIVIVAGVSILAFPRTRSFVAQMIQKILGRAWIYMKQFFGRINALLRVPVSQTAKLPARLWARRYMIALICVILAIPISIAVFNRDSHRFDYPANDIPDPKIRALLMGERLAAPAPLPPDVFTTREVELVRPKLAGANRNWDLLDPDFRQRLLVAYRIMKEQYGYEMVMIEGYRSPERQDELAKLGPQVTNARAFQSYHQSGLAADSAFYRDGKIIISEKDPWAMQGYQLFGKTAEQLGLTWGGRWKMMDFGHVEYRRAGGRPGLPGNVLHHRFAKRHGDWLL